MNTLVVFDVDDTLFHDNIKGTITENEHGLFNFTPYHSASKFSECLPIPSMIARAKSHIELGDYVTFVTARSGMDDMVKYIVTFRNQGLDIASDLVHFAGFDQDNDVPTSELKRPVFEKLLKKNIWNLAIIYEDNLRNAKVFHECCLDADTPFEGWLVTPDTETGDATIEQILI